MQDIKKGDKGEVIRVRAKDFKGKNYLDIRVFYQDKEGEMQPTKKGISISLDIAEAVIAAALKEIGNK